MYLPLLLASADFAAPDEPEDLDRLRMQKGVFLLTKRGPDEWRDLYEFFPYDWGPYSTDLTNDLLMLTKRGRLINDDIRYYHYGSYRTSTLGMALLGDVELADHESRFVRDVRCFVLARPFGHLLRDIYRAFPEYAVNSRYTH